MPKIIIVLEEPISINVKQLAKQLSPDYQYHGPEESFPDREMICVNYRRFTSMEFWPSDPCLLYFGQKIGDSYREIGTDFPAKKIEAVILTACREIPVAMLGIIQQIGSQELANADTAAKPRTLFSVPRDTQSSELTSILQPTSL